METLMILLVIYSLGQINTNADTSAPDYSSSATTVYATRLDGNRDYNKPSYTVDGGYIYQNWPGTDRIRDYRVPPMRIQNLK